MSYLFVDHLVFADLIFAGLTVVWNNSRGTWNEGRREGVDGTQIPLVFEVARAV